MTAMIQFNYTHMPNAVRRTVDLLHGAVLIVYALDAENWARDSRQIFLDVPCPEFVIEPHVAPPLKCRIRMGVIASQAVAQIRSLISAGYRLDTFDGKVFDHDVR